MKQESTFQNILTVLYSVVSHSSHFISQNRLFLYFFGNRKGKLRNLLVSFVNFSRK